MVVHWAGEKSNVIVALARDSAGSTGPKTSSVRPSLPPGLGPDVSLLNRSSRPGLRVLRLRDHLLAGLGEVPAVGGQGQRRRRASHLAVLPQPRGQQAGQYRRRRLRANRSLATERS